MEYTIEQKSLGFFDNNIYILTCQKTNEAVVIDAPAEFDKIIQLIKNKNVKYVLLTHSHPDHTLTVQKIKKATGAKVGVNKCGDNRIVQADFYIKDGDIINFGNCSLKAIYTPGHTMEGTCFIIDNNLFSGDTLFPGGPGKTTSPENFKTVVKSITQKLYTLPENTKVLPGHGKPTTIKESKKEYGVFVSQYHSKDLYGDVLWLGS